MQVLELYFNCDMIKQRWQPDLLPLATRPVQYRVFSLILQPLENQLALLKNTLPVIPLNN